MSLARAFTTKRAKRPEISAPMPQRSMSTTTKTFAAGAVPRTKISGPVQLISTTNMLSYNAPDLYPSSASSLSSDNDSELNKSMTSPLTSPDTSSIESGPCSPEPNHLTSYFNTTRTSTSSGDGEGPSIPQRAPSHTKKTHEHMAHKRSMSRLNSPKNSISRARGSLAMFSNPGEVIEQQPTYAPSAPSSYSQSHSRNPSYSSRPPTSSSTPVTSFSAPGPPVFQQHTSHPFGNELAQVSELAEEFGGHVHIMDDEERELMSRGLLKFGADEYMSEIHNFFVSAYGEVKVPTQVQAAALWI